MTASGRELYEHIDRSINDLLGVSMGWTTLLATRPYPMDTRKAESHRARADVLRRFQRQALELFKASLYGEEDPEIADVVVRDSPPGYGLEYHRSLTDLQHTPPVFFRTDEASGGKVTEVQCSGSGWGLAEQLRDLYGAFESVYGRPEHFPAPLSERFAHALRRHLGRDPVVHHLEDNASRPHGIRYFIQQLRRQGVPHLHYDGGVRPADCNFVRAHDFISLPTQNFFVDRMARCDRGEVFFDLPPSSLFDGKILMAWPFWNKTRHAFDDEVRELFPYTSLIESDGVVLADGEKVALEAFFSRPAPERDYYVKYAGTDIAINWGSKSVFWVGKLSQPQRQELMVRIREDGERGRSWILQQAVRQPEPVVAFGRDGELLESEAYSKLSGFYGPDGLMAILVMQLRSQKVHGSDETVLSLVY